MKTLEKQKVITHDALIPLLSIILRAKREYPNYSEQLEEFYMNAMESLEIGKTDLKFELRLIKRCIEQIDDLVKGN